MRRKVRERQIDEREERKGEEGVRERGRVGEREREGEEKGGGTEINTGKPRPFPTPTPIQNTSLKTRDAASASWEIHILFA